MASESEIVSVYSSLFTCIQKWIQFELFTNRPSGEAKRLMKLIESLAKSEVVDDIVKEFPNPLDVLAVLRDTESVTATTWQREIHRKFIDFFDRSKKTALLQRKMYKEGSTFAYADALEDVTVRITTENKEESSSGMYLEYDEKGEEVISEERTTETSSSADNYISIEEPESCS